MRKRIKYISMMLLILFFMLTFQSVKVEAQCICSACSLICSNLNCFGRSAGDSWCRSSPNDDIKRECTTGSAPCQVNTICGICVWNCGIRDTDCGGSWDVDTGTRQWVSTGECTEKEQRLMNNEIGYCSSGECRRMIVSGWWEDTGANRCKSSVTDCGTDVACVEDTCAVDECSIVGTGRDYSCNDYGFPNCPCDYFTTGCEEYCDEDDYCSGGSCGPGRCGTTSCPGDSCLVGPIRFRDYPSGSCNRYCDGSGNCDACTCGSTTTICPEPGCCDPTCDPSSGCDVTGDDSECSADGWVCNGDIREYRDRYCDDSSCSCEYSVTSSTDCTTLTGCGGVCGCPAGEEPDSCECSGSSCQNTGCSVCPVLCSGLGQSACNAAASCTWCTGDSSCKDSTAWKCNPPSCSGDDRCRNSCTWLDCGTDPCPSDYCSGTTYRDYPATCSQDCSGGSCDPCSCSYSSRNCALGNNWDGDAVACNCDCGGYDVAETLGNGNCLDGLDNDCDGDTDGDDPGCAAPCVPDGCNGSCPVGCDVSQDPDCGCQDGNGCCAPGCSDLNDNDCPSGMCSLTTASITANCAGGSSTDCEVGETIDIDGEFIGACNIDANTYFRINVRSLDGTCTVNLDKQNPSLSPSTTLDTVDLIAVLDGRVTFDRDIEDGCTDSPLAPVDDPESCFRHSTIGKITCAWDQGFEPSGEEDVVRSYVEWDISSIPDASSVSNVDFIYHGSWGWGAARNIYINRMGTRSADHPLLSSLFNDIRTAPRYASHYPSTSPNTLVDLDNDARNDMNNALGTRDWFGIGLLLSGEGASGMQLVADIHDEGFASANPKPTLRVEYYLPMIDDTWTISSISGNCGGKTVYAYEAELWDGQPGVGTLTTRITDSTPSDSSPVDGSFAFSTVCQCSSGACCDGCNYLPNTQACETPSQTQYVCYWGTGCGDDIGIQYLDRYCSGTSADCEGLLGSPYPDPPNLQEDCLSSEKCEDGVSTCNYEFCACVAFCSDGTCDAVCGEDEFNCLQDCGQSLLVDTKIDILGTAINGVDVIVDGNTKTTAGAGTTSFTLTQGAHSITSEDPFGTRPFSHFWDHDDNLDCDQTDAGGWLDISDNPFSFSMAACPRSITAWYKVFTHFENAAGISDSIDYDGYTISGYLLREDDNPLHYNGNVYLYYYDGSWNFIGSTTASIADGYFEYSWSCMLSTTRLRAIFGASNWYYVDSSIDENIICDYTLTVDTKIDILGTAINGVDVIVDGNTKTTAGAGTTSFTLTQGAHSITSEDPFGTRPFSHFWDHDDNLDCDQTDAGGWLDIDDNPFSFSTTTCDKEITAWYKVFTHFENAVGISDSIDYDYSKISGYLLREDDNALHNGGNVDFEYYDGSWNSIGIAIASSISGYFEYPWTCIPGTTRIRVSYNDINWYYVDSTAEESISCECTSGPCCENYIFKPSTEICDVQNQTQYVCYWGTGCGDNVGIQYQDRYCSGSSAGCDGALGSWYADPPNVQDDCDGTEICVVGNDTCNYDYCGCIAYCDDGICDPACGEDENNCVEDCGNDVIVDTRIDVLWTILTGVNINVDGTPQTTNNSGLTTYRVASGSHSINAQDPFSGRPFSHFWDHDDNLDCDQTDAGGWLDIDDNPLSFSTTTCNKEITVLYKVFTRIENITGISNVIDYDGYTISGYLLREDDNPLHYNGNISLEYYDGSWKPIITTLASTIDGYFAEPWLCNPDVTTLRATLNPDSWYYISSFGEININCFEYSGASQVNFSGKLEYKDDTPVQFAKITVTIKHEQEEYIGKAKSDENGDFFLKVDIPSLLIDKDYFVKFYVRNNIEAVYECWYDHITEECNP